MKPTPGKQYTTAQGDTPESISTAAFGNPNQYPDIIDVNRTQTALSFGQVIPTGTIILIPRDTEFEAIRKRQLRRGLEGNFRGSTGQVTTESNPDGP